MSTVTLTDLITRVRQAADMVNTTFVTDAEITNYINSGATELYEILVNTFCDYFTTKTDIALVADQSEYFLPSNFYRLIKVFCIYDGDRYNTRKIDIDLLDTRSKSLYATDDVRALRYYFCADQICFAPAPPTTGTIEMWYVPQMTRLEYGGDTLSISIPVAWDEAIVLDAASACLAKEETDNSFLMGKKRAIIERIATYARERDSAEADMMVDYYGRFV